MRTLLRLLVLAFTLLAAASLARAQERITDFAADIAIAQDSTVTVTETIVVQVENRSIRHGILRDFPTTYTNALGLRVRVPFDVQEVRRDGRPEHYVIEALTNGRRVRIGNAHVTIPRGQHTYVIVYRTARQIGFFTNYDELFWNVTGNAWDFAIDRAEASIHLPSGARVLQHNVYTGAQGARESNATVIAEADRISFATSARLRPREGLTVAVGFTKGVLRPPTIADRAAAILGDNAAAASAVTGLLVLAVFYLVVWARLGRDPARGVIIPLFAPPRDFSAAAVRFVYRMAYDRKCFAAALIAMAVKRYVSISENEKITRLETKKLFTLTRTGLTEAEAGLAATEIAIARVLFSPHHKTIELDNANHATVSAAISALHEALKREDEGVYFVTNLLWLLAGLPITAATGIAAALLADAPADTGFSLAWIGGWIATAAVIGQLLLVALFHRLLKAPTVKGAKIRDEIDGFRMFLETAEKDRLEALHPPHVTPELFEAFLPFAIALDAENAWSRKFEAEAARAGVEPGKNSYEPDWYSGRSDSDFRTGGFATAIGTAIAAATAAAATPPGEASGSGGGSFGGDSTGGGSSGGGGGGGGGSGW